MKLSSDRKLFLGLKLDAGMKRQVEERKTAGRPVFKAGDPAYLEILEDRGDLYIGRVLDPGFAIDDLDDMKRNIRSIIGLTFPDHKPGSSSMRLFAVDSEELSTAGLAANG
jgi:hypothetical protein